MRPRKRLNRNLPPNLYVSKKNGRNYFRYKNPETGKETGMGSDRDRAVLAASELNARLINQGRDLIARVIGAHHMDTWLDSYMKLLCERELSANTLKSRRSMIKYIRKEFGGYELAAISTQHCAEFLKEMQDAGKSRSAQAYRSTLIDIFNEAIRDGCLKSNPASITRPPRVKVKRSRLTLDSLLVILEKAQELEAWVPNSLLLALVTGQRLSDIAVMKFSHISDGWLHVEQQKTGTQVRISLNLRLEAIGYSVGDVIKQCRDQVLSKYIIHHIRNRGNAPSGKPVHPHTISKGFCKARVKTGIVLEHPPTFHELRSLSGRLYAKQGIDVQALLGHKDSRTTSIYTDVRGAEWLEVTA